MTGSAAPAPDARAHPAGGVAGEQPPCVYVVGMHRSGTSAVTGMLAQLGLSVPAGEDALRPTRTNERGHFESKSLIRFNNRLLVQLGGTWSAPPLPVAGWEHTDALASWRAEASDAFAGAFPTRPAAWKDPRTCITLPLWLASVPGPAVAVHVVRHPLAVAASLRKRNRFPLLLGLALWERYVRAASSNLAGVPTIAGDLAALLADGRAWGDAMAGFLQEAGVAVDDASVPRAAAWLDAGLAKPPRDEVLPSCASSTVDVYEAIVERSGPHIPWRAPDLGDEPEWVADVVELRLETDRLSRRHQSLEQSRAYRLVRAISRLRPGSTPQDDPLRTAP